MLLIMIFCVVWYFFGALNAFAVLFVIGAIGVVIENCPPPEQAYREREAELDAKLAELEKRYALRASKVF